MTKEEALKIRKLRETHSWRAIAETIVGSSFQEVGMYLCYDAADVLGEDPDKEPWN